MLERILYYEHDLFLALNGSNSPLLDRFMWLYSGKAVWLPLAVFIAIILVYKKNWRESLLIVIAIALVVTLCDQFASGFCKPMFERLRPTHHPLFMNEVETVFGYRGGKYGFISSHAANAFGFSMFIALLFKDRLFSWIIFSWAAVTAYSRIYLGVHFISDIVPGILVGLLFGFLVYRLYCWARSRLLSRAGVLDPPYMLYTTYQKRLATYAILATVLLILIFNEPLVSLLKK